MNQRLDTPAQIELKDVRLFEVSRKRFAQRTRFLRRKSTAARSRESLVIIGGGMTGFKLCERIHALAGGGAYKITIIGEEPVLPYDRVNLNRLFDGADKESLQLASSEWYSRHGIQLITGDPVVTIERFNNTVVTESHREISFDKLVMATGSRPFIPAIDIASSERVHVYRSLADLESILELARNSSSVAVIGGGLLGVEAAKGMHDLGLKTVIVDHSTGLLARHLDPHAAKIFNQNFGAIGIDIRTGLITDRIDECDGKPVVFFTNGESLSVDFVVLATGVRPRDELAKKCGLELGPRGGVKVDDFLRTNDPKIFAIGECASHRGTGYGLAAPGFLMADVLASRFVGKRKKFEGAEQSCSLKVSEFPMHALGDYQSNGHTHTFSDQQHYRQLVCERNRLVGVVVVGPWSELPRIQEVIDSRRRLSSRQIEVFQQSGLLWPSRQMGQVAEWPGGAVVCNCMRVDKKCLTLAIRDGCSTVEKLSEATGASTVCGSCKPLLAQLVGAPPSSAAASGWKWLLAASVVSTLMGILIAFAPVVPPTQTVQGGWKWETLWRDPFWKQVTGFTMLGLIVLSLGLSLRKRIGWIKFGEFGWWRAVHGGLGAFCLVILVTHTGFSLGENLNFVLMLNFLLLGIWGGLAGLVTALEHRYTGYLGLRIRRIWQWMHIALIWPLPALLAFHIISFYWF